MSSEPRTITPRAGDALLIIDVQNDFLPGGALAVPHGDEVLPPLNRLIASFSRRCLPIAATRDWHPEDHCSFSAQGGPWPPHCIAGSRGAAFSPALTLPHATIVVSKATRAEEDAYSGFGGTDLHSQLSALGVRRLFIGGLATDYCVLNTVRDALARGYEVLLVTDGIRAVDVAPDDGARAVQTMSTLGATLVASGQIAE